MDGDDVLHGHHVSTYCYFSILAGADVPHDPRRRVSLVEIYYRSTYWKTVSYLSRAWEITLPRCAVGGLKTHADTGHAGMNRCWNGNLPLINFHLLLPFMLRNRIV